MSPGTELARDFCAGIGPLQLGVVLVVLIFMRREAKKKCGGEWGHRRLMVTFVVFYYYLITVTDRQTDDVFIWFLLYPTLARCYLSALQLS